MKKTLILKLISIMMIALLFLPILVSCKARPLATTKLARTKVGTVGEYSVLYEEFYFLANGFIQANKASEKYKNDKEALKKDTLEYVQSEITLNYAVLTLCKEFGLEYSERKLRSQVEQIIESEINSEPFNGDRDAFFESQLDIGLTDHYVRFVTGVDALSSQLTEQYKKNKTDGMPSTKEETIDFIMENFVHTWHIVIFVDNENEREAKRQKAEEALAAVLSGDKRISLYENIALYSEAHSMENEISGENSYGYYFPKGYMHENYEKASFALENAYDISGIVEGKALNNLNEEKDCYFIIQRLPSDEEEVKNNLPLLENMISMSITNRRVTEIEKKLSFEMNDYCKGLDILNLEAPKNGMDYYVAHWISYAVLGVVGVIAAIVIIRKIRVKRFHKKLKKK